MYNISTLNKISTAGLSIFGDNYSITDNLDDANAILVRSQNMKDMNFSKNLLAIARAGAGVNNIPIDRCAEEGIVVFNAPGANANAVKELVISSMIIASRNIYNGISWVKTLKDDISSKVEKGKSKFAGSEIKGKTLGVIGLGSIGVLVANAAHSLGMKVIGYDPFITLKSAHALDKAISVVDDLAKILPRCDYITLHVPYMESTADMIDERRIGQMKDGAVLLNFARDKLVNERALVEALDSDKISRYISDFPNETVMGNEKTLLLPHIGASTSEAEDNCAIMAAEELIDFIENGNITNSVNFPNCSMGPLNSEAKARIVILNKNIPSMLGNITGLMADMNINIRDLTNKSKGEFACTIMDIDGDIDDKALKEALNDIEGIVRVRRIKSSISN